MTLWLILPQHTIAQSQLLSTDISIAGQYIVQLPPEKKISEFKVYLESYTGYAVQYRCLMTRPYQLWLIDFKGVPHKGIIPAIKKYNDNLAVFKNRRLENRAVPNDPLLKSQWQYNNTGAGGGLAGADMDMYRGWDLTTGGVNHSMDTIVVCVIDDGVNGYHEDIQSNMWVNRHEIPGNDLDDDGNGYIDDYYGWNVKYLNDSIYHAGSHGTPVAGIIGARGNNGKGVSGVNWNVKIMPVNYGDATEANALASYAYAYDMRKLYNETRGQKGAFIVATNTSWGIDKVHPEEAELWCSVYDALGSVGIINIGATTNSNTDVDIEGDLPTSCNSPYLISVTNLNNSDQKVTGAGYGRKAIDLGAYGQQVFTLNRTSYGNFGGTSGAAPHVTGVIALQYSLRCSIFDSIVRTNPSGAALIAKDMALYGVVSLQSLKDITTSGGKLNAFRALTNMQAICIGEVLPAGVMFTPYSESVQISWIVGSEPFVRIRYRKSEDPDWLVINNFKNGDTIPNLLYCTEYEVQLASSAGLLPGEYGYSTFFRTSGCCTKPTIYNADSGIDHISFSVKTDSEAGFLIKYYDLSKLDTTFVLVDTTYFQLDNIAGCHAYNFSVQAHCLPYFNESAFTDGQYISTTCGSCTEHVYCKGFNNSSSQEWIASFASGGQLMESGRSADGYSDFAGAQVFNFERDASHEFHMKIGYKSGVFSERFKIFIDLDQNGVWSEDELVYNSPVPFRNEISDRFSIPANARTGYSRMRIILSFEDFDNACEQNNFEYGEVEDYCVWIGSTCGFTTLSSVETTIDSAVISLIYGDEVPLSARLYWRPKGKDTWIQVPVADSIVILPDLVACTHYEYFLELICSDTVTTPVSTFKTRCNSRTDDTGFQVNIFPNPTREILYLHTEDKQIEIEGLRITNILGVDCLSIENDNKSDSYKIDISNLRPGIYFVNIRTKQGWSDTVVKFIKM
ncbi:MAG TPA: S8/S53 family peptidase [Saprospiraceae bacterium]|nr:S8/S53 family peptidase [Saprospiraceae bacterium]HRP41320.1 S8/S53 family peptidase [Saprospiraceae bacterium]